MALVRHITVPAPITITVATEKGPATASVPFARFLDETLLADRAWGKTLTLARKATEIATAAASLPVGGDLAIGDQDYQMLLASMESPSLGYEPALIRQLLPFCDAIRDATGDPPGAP